MQTVVITGGTSGIGLATADIFLENGWNTVLIGRDAAKGMQVERQLGETYSPAQVAFIQADISKSSEVEHAKQINLKPLMRLSIMQESLFTMRFMKPVRKIGIKSLMLMLRGLSLLAKPSCQQ